MNIFTAVKNIQLKRSLSFSGIFWPTIEPLCISELARANLFVPSAQIYLPRRSRWKEINEPIVLEEAA